MKDIIIDEGHDLLTRCSKANVHMWMENMVNIKTWKKLQLIHTEFKSDRMLVAVVVVETNVH